MDPGPDGTPLERAQRRVVEEEALMAAQASRVADLARRGLDTTEAQAVLVALEQSLRFMREDLTREQERAATSAAVKAPAMGPSSHWHEALNAPCAAVRGVPYPRRNTRRRPVQEVGSAADVYETDLEKARRHVAEAQRRLTRQRALMAALAELGRDTATAQQMLAVFEATLQTMLEHVALEEWLAAGALPLLVCAGRKKAPVLADPGPVRKVDQ